VVARQGAYGVVSEALLLLAALVEVSHRTPGDPAVDGVASGLLGRRSFALLVLLVHVVSVKRGVATVERTRARVSRLLAEAPPTAEQGQLRHAPAARERDALALRRAADEAERALLASACRAAAKLAFGSTN